MFGVCLQEYERWLCPYEASCDVFSELGPVSGPITVTGDAASSGWPWYHHRSVFFGSRSLAQGIVLS
jgi:hypothetical protein